MSHLTDIEQAALRLMNRLIYEGWEYPDAEEMERHSRCITNLGLALAKGLA